MAKFRVYGSIPIGFTMIVEAESERAAKDKAWCDWPGLTDYAGNGGSGRLVGHSEAGLFLQADDGADPHIANAEPADEDEEAFGGDGDD